MLPKPNLPLLLAALLLAGAGCVNPIPENCAEWKYGYNEIRTENGVYVTVRHEGECLKTR